MSLSVNKRTGWVVLVNFIGFVLVALAIWYHGDRSTTTIVAGSTTVPVESLGAVAEWVQILLFTAAGGILGGTLGSMESIDARAMMNRNEFQIGWSRCGNVIASIAVGGLGGIGGAMAALFVAVIDDKIKSPLDHLGKVKLFTLATISGFIGLQLLRTVAERLKKTVETARVVAAETAEQVASKKVGEVASELRQDINDVSAKNTHFSAAMSLAANALGSREDDRVLDSLRKDALEQLEHVRPHFSDRRTIGIFMGRLLRQLGQFQKAIDVLSEVLLARRNKKISPNEDDAALLYNRACYHNMLARSTPELKEKLRDAARADLMQALDLHPAYTPDVALDPDLKELEMHGNLSSVDNEQPTSISSSK